MSTFYKSNNCCLIITGASKGFGRVLAKKFAENFCQQFKNDANNSLNLILIARTCNELDSLENEIQSIDSNIKVLKICANLADCVSIEHINNELNKLNMKSIDHFILIHNAGSLGNTNELCTTVNVADAKKRNAYYRLNLFSVMELTSLLLQKIQNCNENINFHIINISSLAAIQPMKGLLDYCIGKASREAYFKQLSMELCGDDSNKRKYRILQYAPGPLDTEMFHTLQNDSLLKKQFQECIPLTPEQSADKLLQILTENKFINGSHIDYYDNN